MLTIETDVSIAKTLYAGAPAEESVLCYALYMYPTATGLLTSAVFTLYWFDNTGIERSHTETILLTALSNFKAVMIPYTESPEGGVSYSVVVTGTAAVKIMCGTINIG